MTLGSELVARGHSVHVLGHESTRGPFEQGGLFFTTWANTLEPPFIRHYMPEDEEYEWATEHIFFATAYQDELRLAIEDLEPDVVLVDHALRYAILEAMRADQPLVVLCHIPYSAMVSFEGEDQKLEAFKDAVRRDELPEYVSRRAWIETADSILVFSYAGFDPLSGDEAGENVLYVGPLRTAINDGDNLERRYPDRPLVLISLSTSDQNQNELLQRLCDACAQLPVEALVTTGPTVPADSLDTSDNVTAVEYVDHGIVLPDADLLVTHAGHGTVAAGLKHGVPMLCVPFGRDQPFNADRVRQLGLGSVIDADTSPAQLRLEIDRMLADSDQRQRSESFARSLEDHPGLDEALNAIEQIFTA